VVCVPIYRSPELVEGRGRVPPIEPRRACKLDLRTLDLPTTACEAAHG
jgi:hypothetical protein